jgi:MFS family permease
LGAEELLNSQGAFGLLGSQRFGPLFATQFLSAFNDNALRNALVLMIAYRADAAAQLSAQIMIPLAAGLFMLPFFLCSATAGQIADESDKAGLIRLIKLIEIPVMLVAAGGVLAGSATVLLALLFVMGIVAAFFGPLKYAILPDLLAPQELLLGNALVEAGTFIAILLGTIAGMVIATRHGSAAVAGLIVAVALAAWVASRGIPPTTPAARGGAARWNLLGATVRVIRQARAVPLDARHLMVLVGRRDLSVAVSRLCPLHPRSGRSRRNLVSDVIFSRDRVRFAAVQSLARRPDQRTLRPLGGIGDRAVLDRFVARQPAAG